MISRIKVNRFADGIVRRSYQAAATSTKSFHYVEMKTKGGEKEKTGQSKPEVGRETRVSKEDA